MHEAIVRIKTEAETNIQGKLWQYMYGWIQARVGVIGDAPLHNVQAVYCHKIWLVISIILLRLFEHKIC